MSHAGINSVGEITSQSGGAPARHAPAVIWLCAGAVLMLMSVPRLGAQDPLASARSLYASAAYDEALKTLTELSAEGGGRIAGASFREVEEYRFLCLLALGRNSEAKESISAVVTADPLYKLDENTTSPRVLNAFRAVRREVLPDILTNIYNAGKSMCRQQGLQGRRAAVPQGDRPGKAIRTLAARAAIWRRWRRASSIWRCRRTQPRRPRRRRPRRWRPTRAARRRRVEARRRLARALPEGTRRLPPTRIARSSRRSRRRAKSFRPA